MAHHRLLGTADDPERSYFLRPDARFVARSLAGLAVLDVLGNRRAAAGDRTMRRVAVPLIGAVGHAVVVIGAVITGNWWLAVAWTMGVISLYPFFNALRQNLEHRTFDAHSDVDYAMVNQGALTRCFAGSIGGFLLGGVGFDRHLIHHWDASISYTNLGELERLLRRTQAAPILEVRSTTYLSTWRELSAKQ
jgi:fatty acid desaturase